MTVATLVYPVFLVMRKEYCFILFRAAQQLSRVFAGCDDRNAAKLIDGTGILFFR